MKQTKWIDFHSHILPNMDDGSSGAKESVKMLAMEAEQNVQLVVATPHFYADRDRPDRFFERRAAAIASLRQAWNPSLPKLRFGAEVAYFTGMSHYEGLSQLCILGTNLLMVEMPFCPWPDNVVQEVIALQTRCSMQVLLAHVERYARPENEPSMRAMRDAGILFQCNAGPLLRWQERWKMLWLLDRGMVHVLGSDCHNATVRPPNMAQGIQIIEKKRGTQPVRTLRDNGWNILQTGTRGG